MGFYIDFTKEINKTIFFFMEDEDAKQKLGTLSLFMFDK